MKPAKEMPNLKCPLCEDQTLEYRLVNNHTHAWVCMECPAVLMEFYDERNSADLHKNLGGGKIDG